MFPYEKKKTFAENNYISEHSKSIHIMTFKVEAHTLLNAKTLFK